MNYTKPEVAVLGNASAVIEQTSGKVAPKQDSPSPISTPAYDLDE